MVFPTRSTQRSCALLIAVILWPSASLAQQLAPAAPGTPQSVTAPDGRPTPTILASDADLSQIDRAREGNDWPDRLKAVDIGTNLRLSISGIGYVEAEAFDNENFGARPGFNAFWNTRLNVYASAAIGDQVRIFTALKHGERRDYGAFVPPVERDTLDLHQAFVELRLGQAVGLAPNDLLLRAGRQELHYGAGRMISVRQGPNVRQDFDGGLVRLRLGSTVIDGFAMYDVIDRPGAFDNGTSQNDGVWGVYGSRALTNGRQFEAYYIGERRSTSSYVQGTFRETRHSLGARWSRASSPASPWSGDIEATFQLGQASSVLGQDANILAWTVSGQLTHTWHEAALKPAIIVTAGISSGDSDPTDRTIGTFRAPNPPGRYFGETTPFGPGNLFGGSVGFSFTPAPGWTVEPDANFFWRLETGDGTYMPNGMLVRGAAGGSRFAGWEIGAATRYRIGPHLSLRAEAEYFMVGPYLRDNKPAENVFRLVTGIDVSF